MEAYVEDASPPTSLTVGANVISTQPRQVELTNEEIDAVGCFLEYLYTGDYFPRKVQGQRSLKLDPSLPSVDETGEQLLKHARVYTLAEKFGIDRLKSLASSKIHCVNSTAKGEITYARYVYQYTRNDDTTVRAPIANFWATRSHTLRAEAEDEFRALCLEFPQFGYDVLSKFFLPALDAHGTWRSLTYISQPASWTTSSSENGTINCTQHQAAHASDRDIAKFDQVCSSYYDSPCPFFVGGVSGKGISRVRPKAKERDTDAYTRARVFIAGREDGGRIPPTSAFPVI